jgi:hypothetical protein
LNLAIEHLALNPFLAIPVLLCATAAIAAYRGVHWAVLGLLPWGLVFLLCIFTVEDGHGAARIYANWLILILPLAGYGISLLWNAPQRLAPPFAVLALICFAVLPLAARDRFTTQYLEIVEHERFNGLLSALPAGVRRIIVPDDELMWRRYHSTLELFRKYAAILYGRPEVGRHVQLIALTDYLENPKAADCANGACLFFFGVPCMDQAMYPVTADQCATLLREQRTSLLSETTLVAAPFVSCSIYVGELKRRFCDPATAARSFRVYRIENAP